MKGMQYVYRDSDGKLKIAMSTKLFLGICVLFLALPLIAFIQWIYHIFTNNATWITKEKYHRIKMNEYKRKAHKKTQAHKK